MDGERCRAERIAEVIKGEARRVPELVTEVAVADYAVNVEVDVLALRRVNKSININNHKVKSTSLGDGFDHRGACERSRRVISPSEIEISTEISAR